MIQAEKRIQPIENQFIAGGNPRAGRGPFRGRIEAPYFRPRSSRASRAFSAPHARSPSPW